MKRCLLTCVCAFLLFVGLFLATGWSSRDGQPPSDAWVCFDQPERILFGISPGQDVNVAFRVKNTSRRPLRVFGGEAC
jgi:hypothetical protein